MDRRVRLSREHVLIGLMAAVALWMIGSLIQAAAMNRSLGQQAAELRSENAALQSTNDGYQRDIAAVSSGGAGEEAARRDGYARSDERLYIVVTPTPPPPPPPARPAAARRAQPAAARDHGSDNPLTAVLHLLTGAHDG